MSNNNYECAIDDKWLEYWDELIEIKIVTRFGIWSLHPSEFKKLEIRECEKVEE